MRGTPVLILNQNTRREHGKDVQFGNIEAGKTVADVIRTCLGPRAMLKMLLDPMGSIVMTNDGNAILREITVEHPAAKSMIEIARTQDEEVGDGTTSVIVLAGEVLSVAAPCLEKQIHPTKIITAFRQALEDITTAIDTKLSIPVDVNNHEAMVNLVKSCVGTKIINKWVDLASKLAISSVKVVTIVDGGRKEIDIKRYAKVEKIPGGSIEDSCVLDGVMFNKDILHPKMRRRIESPRILLLDCSLDRALEIEEEYIGKICEEIIRHKPDVVITEKGVSDLAQHFLVKAGISVIRRLRKTDCLRIGRCSGATIVSRTDEIKEEDIGTGAGLFEVKLIGDEYFTFITGCKDPKACTILLRGASKDVLNEIERNLQDAMSVVRSAFMDPRLVPGGGALEMALAQELSQKAKSAVSGVQKVAYLAVAQALEVIPRTLAQNCGANVLKQITELRAYHAIDPAKNWTMGINGETGQLVDMKELGVWDPVAVKSQTFKTAIETAILLLRIDDIVSGTKKAADTDSKP
ncbi:T-complex protein 1 subunit gamma [Echinococcus granulosus]|nr:T-complex protein 1 subunit gamma [Echinococcus granulosus]